MIGLSLGRPPKKLIRPCRAAICTACSCAAPDAAAVMMTSTPRPSVSLMIVVDGVGLAPSRRRASGLTIAAACSSRSALSSTRITRAAPRARASRTCRQPIGPEPMTTTSSPAPTRASSWRVDGAGERLGHRRLGEAETVGDAVEAVDGQHLGRARPCTRRSRRRSGSRSTPGWGRRSCCPRRHSAHCPHGIAAMTWTRSPGGPALDAVADLDHLAGDLVTHDPRRHDVLVAEPEDLHVGAAGRAVAHPDLDVTGTRRSARARPRPGCLPGRRTARPSCAVTCVPLPRSAAARAARLPVGLRRAAPAPGRGPSAPARAGRAPSTWPSPAAAMPTHTVTSSPSQSTGSAKRR